MGINERIGNNIRNIRIQKGISQTELAEMLGYKDSTTLTRMEHGLVDMNSTRLNQIAFVLGVTLADLFGRENFAMPFDDVLTTAYHRAPKHLQDAVNLILQISNITDNHEAN